MIKAHPGLKPLEEVDSEMAELIAQEQRRQACAPRPKKPLREREGGLPYRDAFASTRPRPSTPSTRRRGRARRIETRAATPRPRLTQFTSIELIASENFASRAIMDCLGSCLTNKYA